MFLDKIGLILGKILDKFGLLDRLKYLDLTKQKIDCMLPRLALMSSAHCVDDSHKKGVRSYLTLVNDFNNNKYFWMDSIEIPEWIEKEI
jgi:hypothetical protein